MEINTTPGPYPLLKTMPPKNLSVAQHATGKTKLLDMPQRYANQISAPFGSGKRGAATGYLESELALVELFRESSQARTLALAAFFVDQRCQETMNLAVQIRSSASLKAIWQEDLLGKITGIKPKGLWTIGAIGMVLSIVDGRRSVRSIRP